MSDKPKAETSPEIHRDIALTDLLVRMTAIETLLRQKGILQDEEYTIILKNLLQEMEKHFKELRGESLSDIISLDKRRIS